MSSSLIPDVQTEEASMHCVLLTGKGIQQQITPLHKPLLFQQFDGLQLSKVCAGYRS